MANRDMYPKVKITQLKSTINRPKNQKATIQALGLGKDKSGSGKRMHPPDPGYG